MKKYKKLDDFYVEDGEEHLIRRIMPEVYAGRNLHKILDADYAVRFMQNELNSVLNSFVNGGFSYRGFVMYPLVKDISKDNLKKIKRLKDIAAFLNENGYDFSDSIGRYRKSMDSHSFASVLSTLYRDFSSIKNRNGSFISKPACRQLDMPSYKKSDSKYLRPLAELNDYANTSLKQYLSGFYLHGSLATKDYVKGWSDADTLAIISKETMENPKRLLELRDSMYRMRYFFYRIDPLQHHGSMAISEYDFGNYCQAYFPLPIFRYAKSFFKNDKTIKFRVRSCKNEALSKLFWFVSYFRKLNIEKRFNPGSYDAKNLLHSVTLFPSMYLQAKGILAYKKFSFGIAKKDFKKESWEVIDSVSGIRANWKHSGLMPLVGFYSRVNPLLCYQINSRVMDLFKDMKKANNIDAKQIIEKMLGLSEEAWSKVKKDVKNEKL